MNWNVSQYRENASYVSDYGREIVSLLEPKAGERILDLGSGEGALAQMICDAGADVLCIDPSEAMVEAVRKRGIRAECLRAENLDALWTADKAENGQAENVALSGQAGDSGYIGGRRAGSNGYAGGQGAGDSEAAGEQGTGDYLGQFDAVFSNAALHWVRNMRSALRNIHGALKQGGRFCAEFGAEGNVGTIVRAIHSELAQRGVNASALNPWYFPSKAEFLALLRAQGFRIRFAEVFGRPTPLAQGMRAWLETFAEPFLAGVFADVNAPMSEGATSAGEGTGAGEAVAGLGKWSAPTNAGACLGTSAGEAMVGSPSDSILADRSAERSRLLSNIEALLEPELRKADGTWFADYIRLRILAEKM